MLSKLEVYDLIRQRELDIEYDIDPTSSTGELLSEVAGVDIHNANSAGSKIFESNYFGNRLSFTLGPLIYSHTYETHAGRVLYQNRPGIFDLRQTEGKFLIEPGESVTVNTIEYLELGKSVGALTLPRLTHATAGVVLSTSYVDPYWNGIMVFHVANTSSDPYELKIGEKIGACHFYEVSRTDLDDSFRVRFSQKSHHYGQRWSQIFSADADPFPMRKRPVSGASSNSNGKLQLLRRYWKKIAASLGGLAAVGAIVGGIFYAGQLWSELQEVRGLPDLANNQGSSIMTIEDQVKAINSVLGK